MIISTLQLEEPYRSELDAAAAGQEVHHCALAQLSDDALAKVQAVFSYGADLSGDVLDNMPALRWIHIGQSGMEHLPMSLLAERGIVLTNSRGINSVAISEYVLCMMLNVVRRHDAFYESQRARRWNLDTRLDELCGKTVGILGLGKVGAEIALRADAFGMRVLGMDVIQKCVPHVEHVYLPQERCEMFAQCDFIVICMPLTPDTKHLIASQELSSMKPSAWVINVGRGAILQQSDLLSALEANQIGGAVLDVFEEEPLPPENALWGLSNVRITPHIAGDHLASYMPRMMKILCSNLRLYPDFSAMENLVDTSRGF